MNSGEKQANGPCWLKFAFKIYVIKLILTKGYFDIAENVVCESESNVAIKRSKHKQI